MINKRAEYAEILMRIFENGATINTIKNTAPEQEKSFINMLFMTALRQLHFIQSEVLTQFVKKKIAQKHRILEYILYLGATEILFLNTPDYAVISSYVEAAKAKTDRYGANFVNAVLRNILYHKANLLNNRKSAYFSKKFLNILKQDYTSDEIREIEKYAQIEPGLDLTVKQGYNFVNPVALQLPSGSFRFPANTKVPELNGYQDGYWWVQDAASALPVRCLKNLAGKKVLDCCAAPGGKTAQLLDAGAYVTAVDISPSRLAILEENIQRLHLAQRLTVVCSDILQYYPEKRFDIILLDAPCSATGTFRRHPEIMHTKTLDDVKTLVGIQQKLLEHISSMVCPGGLLVYTTCSLAKAEGERQIRRFIAAHQEYSILPLMDPKMALMRTKDGFLRILPQHYQNFGGIDGFFIACLQRNN